MFTTSLLALTTSLPALTTSLLALTSLLPFARAAPLFTRDVNVGFPYGQQKIRGVNLGGVSRHHRRGIQADDCESGSCSNRLSLYVFDPP